MSFMKKKPGTRSKQTVSRLQEGRVIKIIIALVLLALLWILFAPGSGVVSLISKRSELKKLEQDTAKIEQQINELQNDIDRLHNDPEYLEDIARREFGLLKKNETVYDFSKEQTEKKDKE